LLLKNNGEAKLIGEVALPKGFLPTLQEYNKWIDEYLANKERIREIETDHKREEDKREKGISIYESTTGISFTENEIDPLHQ